jgi:TolB-like protein/DNA-binding winged helix-turn-helix (wHTH) protein
MAGPGTDRGQPVHVLRFGTFELDPTTQRLRKSGALVRRQSQHFQLPALLVERSGKVVAREEIREALWGSQTFVDFDRGINLGINQIRSALDDDPGNPRFIETVPRKGYRFIAPVSATNLEEAASSTGKDEAPGLVEIPELAATSLIRRRSSRFLMLTLAGAVAVVSLIVYGYQTRHWRSGSIQSLAVLPLQNLTIDPRQEYVPDGMTEELITALAKIGALRVVSRTSVMQFRGTKKPLPEIARELGVDAVVKGAVLRSHNRVRITIQLIRASLEEHLWAEQYEGSPEEVLTLLDTVAQDVARSIKVNLTAKERILLTTPRPVDPQAHEQYLRGRYLWSLPSEENFTKSLDYLKQAIQIDPNYALAWSVLADTYENLASWGVMSNQDALPLAQRAAEKTFELDGSLVSPLAALATVKMNYEWDWAGVEGLCRRAIELSPMEYPSSVCELLG